jgi:hypothetical protein
LVRRSHYAVGLSLGSVDFPWRGWPVAFQRLVKSPLFELRLPPEYYPVEPSRSAATDQLLSWAFGPFSTCRSRRSTVRELAEPTSLRLQGLVTLLTVYSLRFLGGFVSRRQHSWDSPFGAIHSNRYSRRSPPEWTHVPFLLPLFPCAEAPGRPDRPQFLGFNPAESPDRNAVGLTPPPPGDSLGFQPSRACRKGLDQDFARSPLTCFADEATNGPASRHPRVSISLCLSPPLGQSRL